MKYKRINTTISSQLQKDLKQYNIKYSEALRTGATFLLSKKAAKYQTTLQLRREMDLKKDKLIFMLNDMLELNLTIKSRKN